MTRDDELKYLKMQLKHGEYDGLDIMQAWLAIDELLELRAWREKAFNVHPNIDADINALDENVGV
ncbi:MAG TPA: hypothetical protein PLC01_02520 [Methylotenera sp.]|jgi:hypothetical protein|nr:hypothetical protein [Methylotenera sp.]